MVLQWQIKKFLEGGFSFTKTPAKLELQTKKKDHTSICNPGNPKAKHTTPATTPASHKTQSSGTKPAPAFSVNFY